MRLQVDMPKNVFARKMDWNGFARNWIENRSAGKMDLTNFQFDEVEYHHENEIASGYAQKNGFARIIDWKWICRKNGFDKLLIWQTRIPPGKSKWLKAGILKGEVSLYHWPPDWLVWNQLYDN